MVHNHKNVCIVHTQCLALEVSARKTLAAVLTQVMVDKAQRDKSQLWGHTKAWWTTNHTSRKGLAKSTYTLGVWAPQVWLQSFECLCDNQSLSWKK